MAGRNVAAGAAGSGRKPCGFVLALDEVQTIPEWSSTVKGLWDADRAENRLLHVILLGSAPLLIQSGLTESLAGRFANEPGNSVRTSRSGDVADHDVGERSEWSIDLGYRRS